MDPAEEEQVGPRGRMEMEGVGVDAVVDGGQVVEAGVAVGVADGDVGAPAVVLLVHREDPRRREPVDRGEHGRRDEPAVAEGQEVEAVVDEIELAGALEGRGDVEAFRHLGVEAGVLRPPAGNHRGQPGRREGVAGGEEGDVDAPRHQALGQQRHEPLPRPVVAGGDPPRDRRQHSHSHAAHSRPRTEKEMERQRADAAPGACGGMPPPI